MSDNRLSWEEAVLRLKQQPDQAALVRACFYDDPLLQAASRYAASTEWQAIHNYLPPVVGRALDIGAGRGITAYALAKNGWHTTALEPDPSAVVGAGAIRSLAAEACLEIEVVESTGERLPFPAASFDLVHCRQVLHHSRDLTDFMREVGRVLKSGGTFIATREHVISRKTDLARFLEQHPLHQLYGGEHAYLLEEYLAAIRLGGIRLTKILNPYQSDINLYPETVDGLRRRLAARLHLPSRMLPSQLLTWLGKLSRQPGRLYTFVGYKS